ncbi:MAG: DUF2153 family protein [Sulfolobaceae archaeon]|nr:DUF2153 family protein [Sulfolobaceae archaeon]
MNKLNSEDIKKRMIEDLTLLQKIVNSIQQAPDQDRLSFLLDSIAIIRTLKFQLESYEKFLMDEEIQHVISEETTKKIRDNLIELLNDLINSTLQIINEIVEVEVKSTENDPLTNLLLLTFKRLRRTEEAVREIPPRYQ